MAIIHQLIMRSGPTPGKEFPLENVETHIGRDLDNDIVINDAEVSRHHATISLQMENFVLEDKGSTNGTSINGRRITAPYTLKSGDIVTFGEHVDLLYEGGVDPNATVMTHTVQQQQRSAPVYTPPEPVNPAYQAPIPREEFVETINPPEKKKFPWLIVILVVLLLIVCVCGMSLYLIDSNNMWCNLFPFLFSACTPGA
jgi:pSer/pThr/pTyr-binding forkhead associated (FHA) protein